MEITHGKVLDIGCGAGSHSLFYKMREILALQD